MNKNSIWIAMLAILAFASSMMANENNREESETSTIKFSDCPKAVQKTLTRKLEEQRSRPSTWNAMTRW